MINLPGLGVKDILDGVSNIVEWYDDRKKVQHQNAWKYANLQVVYNKIVEYYKEIDNLLFSYPQRGGAFISVPLLVLTKWKELSNSSLKMNFSNIHSDFYPSTSQISFWEFYSELKDFDPYDLDVFRLFEINDKDETLRLDFELGKFSHSVMCQYILEDELVTLLSKNPKLTPEKLELRNSVVPNLSMIFSYFRNNICRIGLCTLLLLRQSDEYYVAIVQKRGKSSMIQQDLFDPVSSCVFEVSTTPKADFELKHTMLREIYEELFGNPEVASTSRRLDPEFFYNRDGIVDLIKLLKDGSAEFEVTGFCIDLIRMVPEITAVLVVRDDEYFKRHYKPKDSSIAPFHLNLEFNLGSLLRIPSKIGDVEYFLTEKIITDPDGNKKVRGFNPIKWTIPGGFSFCQGISAAVNRKLL